jgi:hypothetical protein
MTKMKKTNKTKMIWLAGALLGTVALAQDSGDRVTVPFRDASRPRTLVVSMIQGSITVRGYNGNDAIVEGSGGSHRRSNPPEPGMHRIDPNSGFDITEDNNTITIHGGVIHSSDVTVQIPAQTTLRLKTVNGGKITVEGVSGDVEADNTNGSVIITDVSGSVVANSTNGKVTVTLNKVTPNKNMSFSTLNGTVDVTLPADTKANLRMRTDNGDIWTDFDVKLDGAHPPQVDDQRKNGGKYRVRMDKTIYGSINGGGPEIQLVTYNGSIYLRKK